jgi:hypothetical protein
MVTTPDGRTVCVLYNSRDVLPIRTATNAAMKPKPIPVSEDPRPVRDSSQPGQRDRLFTERRRPGKQRPDTPSALPRTPLSSPIKLPGNVTGMAMEPNRKTAYMSDCTRRGGYALVPVDLATRLRLLTLSAPFSALSIVAFTSNGRMAYIAAGAPCTRRGPK